MEVGLPEPTADWVLGGGWPLADLPFYDIYQVDNTIGTYTVKCLGNY